jgi:hypothetical protein
MSLALRRVRKATIIRKEADMAAYVYAQTDPAIVSTAFPKAWLEKASECFWGSLCLLLFMVLGPFSAPIVLGYIFFGKIHEQGSAEPDPVSGNQRI